MGVVTVRHHLTQVLGLGFYDLVSVLEWGRAVKGRPEAERGYVASAASGDPKRPLRAWVRWAKPPWMRKPAKASWERRWLVGSRSMTAAVVGL